MLCVEEEMRICRASNKSGMVEDMEHTKPIGFTRGLSSAMRAVFYVYQGPLFECVDSLTLRDDHLSYQQATVFCSQWTRTPIFCYTNLL